MKNRYLEIPEAHLNRQSMLYLGERSVDVESEFDCHLENFYRQMQYSNQLYQCALLNIARNRIRLEYQNQREPLKIRRQYQIIYSALRIIRLIIKRLITRFLRIFSSKKMRLAHERTSPVVIEVYPVEQDDERRTYYE